MRIPLTDLTAQYRALKGDIDDAIHRTMASGSFILGPEVEAFEQEMAAFCQTGHAVGVASGTDALYLALLACGIGEGDEVLTTPFTFIATAEAIARCGAKPVFVDIEPQTCNIDLRLLKRHLSKATRAIIPVHLYGNPLDMSHLMEFASAHGIEVVEDCAQALGATWRGRKVGSFGDAGCLSFFPSKILGACGDAGMIVTSDSYVAERVRALRSHGSKRKYYHDIAGINSRLDALQAAVLRVKLRCLKEWIEQRRAIATLYAALLRGIPGISLPRENDGALHVYNYYTIRITGGAPRDTVASYLAERGIATAVYYPKSLHLQPVYEALGYRYGDFPVSETTQDAVLSLPMYPELTVDQVEEIAHTLVSCPALRDSDLHA